MPVNKPILISALTLIVASFLSKSMIGQEKNGTPPKDPLRELLLSKGYVAVPLIKDEERGSFVVECHVGTEKLRLLLDTGSANSLIDIDLANKLGLEDKGEVKATGIQGVNTGIKTSIRGLSIGDFDTREAIQELEIAALAMTWSNKSTSEKNRLKVDGLLGQSALEFCSAVIDYSNHRLYLRTPLRGLWPEIEGKWLAIRAEEEGQERSIDTKKPAHLIFKDRRIKISDGTNVYEYGIHLVPGKDRHTLGLFAPDEEKNETMKYIGAALLKVSGDKMTVCLCVDASKNTPADFKTTADSGHMLLELKKEK